MDSCSDDGFAKFFSEISGTADLRLSPAGIYFRAGDNNSERVEVLNDYSMRQYCHFSSQADSRDGSNERVRFAAECICSCN